MNKLTYNGIDYTGEITSNAGSIDLYHAMVGEVLKIDSMDVPVITEDIPVRLLSADQGESDFLLDSEGAIICASSGNPAPQFIRRPEFYFNDSLVCNHYLKKSAKILYE